MATSSSAPTTPLGDRLEELHRPAFWRSLAPQWDVGDGPRGGGRAIAYAGEPFTLTEAERDANQQLIRQEGYLQGKADWGIDHQAMAALVRRLDAMAIPPVFAFIYDIFWIPFFQLHHHISALLGGSYLMLPDCWIWNIDPLRNGAGWAPHRDRDHTTLLPCGSPKIINVWLPLSAATPLSSCMYILPADRDPVYGSAKDSKPVIDLSSVRALPTVPGDYLIWNQAVLHWGSRSSPRAEASRVSMAWEFQRLDVPTYDSPCVPLLHWPDFEGRLMLIAHQLLHFGSPGFFARIDPALMRWAAALNPEQGQRRHPSQRAPGQTAAATAEPQAAVAEASASPSVHVDFTAAGADSINHPGPFDSMIGSMIGPDDMSS